MIGNRKTGFCSAHELGQLFVDNFNNHLSRSKAFHNLLSDGSLGNLFGKVLGNLVVNVRLKQSQTNLTHCAADVRFGQRALAFQSLKSGFKSF